VELDFSVEKGDYLLCIKESSGGLHSDGYWFTLGRLYQVSRVKLDKNVLLDSNCLPNTYGKHRAEFMPPLPALKIIYGINDEN